MNFIEVCKDIKSNYVDRDDILHFLICKYPNGRIQNGVKQGLTASVKVKEGKIVLDELVSLSLDKLAGNDWELLIAYKEDNPPSPWDGLTIDEIKSFEDIQMGKHLKD